MATISALDVAQYFLDAIDAEVGDNLSNLKLQKLVYYAQGFHLAMHGTPLFHDPIEAWAHGPAVPTLYRRFEGHGSGALPRADRGDYSDFDGPTRDLLDEVLQVYGQFSAWKLRDMTHEEPPWRLTPLNGVIAHELMASDFRTLLIHG